MTVQLERPTTPVVVSAPMMGGRVSLALLDDRPQARLELAGARVLRRMDAWAGRLSRFVDDSELRRLNASAQSAVPVGPTLAGVLGWARTAEDLSDGLVDVTLLDARLAAEAGTPPPTTVSARGRRWSLGRRHRGAIVRREPGCAFDLDGVAKGWLADRALAIAPGRSAIVDGDGDVAVRVAPGDAWAVGIADARETGAILGVLTLTAAPGAGRSVPSIWGVATSGTSVHRWAHPGGDTHHLIDPRTRLPAVTDVVQATVLAASAREAEAYAKAAVILGSGGAFAALDHAAVHGLLLLTRSGEVRATSAMLRWLA